MTVRWQNLLTRLTAAITVVLVSGVVTSGCRLGLPDGPGTRSNPIPVGGASSVGSYEVSVGLTQLDGSVLLRAADSSHETLRPGTRFVLAPFTVVLTGADVGVPWEDLAVRYVAADGRQYGTSDAEGCGEVPDSLGGVGEITAGTAVTGYVCVAVPTRSVADGRWLVKPEGSLTDWTGYFAATLTE